MAISRDADKEADARNLGAHHYIDSTAGDIGAALKALGGATVVLAAVANSKAMADTVRVIAPQGELVIIGVTADPLPISPMDLTVNGITVRAYGAGTSRDVEETMHFGLRARIEQRDLIDAADAYARREQGEARYRMVPTV